MDNPDVAEQSAQSGEDRGPIGGGNEADDTVEAAISLLAAYRSLRQDLKSLAAALGDLDTFLTVTEAALGPSVDAGHLVADLYIARGMSELADHLDESIEPT